MRKLFSMFLIILVLIGTSGCKRNSSNDQSELILPVSDELSASSKSVFDIMSNTSSGTSLISTFTNSTTTSTTISTESVVTSTTHDESSVVENIESPAEIVTSTMPPFESITSSKENGLNDNEDIESAEELVGVNKFRPDYDLNECRNLSGDITVIVFYLDDFESRWTPDEIAHFTEKEIKPGLKFLEDSAKKFNINLKLKIEEVHSSIYYNDKVYVDIKKSGYATGDALHTAAKHLGYKSDIDFISNYKTKYSTEIICYCIFNKEGTSYALNPKRGTTVEIPEHVLMFAYDMNSTGYEPEGWQSSVIAHETLHLYGAEDYYNPAERKALAKKYCPNDIMLSCQYYLSQNDFGDATAFYIGWTDNVPPILYESGW